MAKIGNMVTVSPRLVCNELHEAKTGRWKLPPQGKTTKCALKTANWSSTNYSLPLLHKSAKTGRNRFSQNKSGWQMKVHRNEHDWLNKESTCAWTYHNSSVMGGTWARVCEALVKQQNLSPRLSLASAWKPAGKGWMDYSRVPKAACLGNLPHFWSKCQQRLSKKTCWFINNQQCYLLFWPFISLLIHITSLYRRGDIYPI